jgi:hypothetical protein
MRLVVTIIDGLDNGYAVRLLRQLQANRFSTDAGGSSSMVSNILHVPHVVQGNKQLHNPTGTSRRLKFFRLLRAEV